MSDLAKAVRSAKHVYIIGNGGSAANAEHIANDLVACGIRAHALTSLATLTAIANDFGWENVFSRQIALYGEPGDLLIAMSGSGKSPNILRAVDQAESLGMKVFKIFGNERGEGMQNAEEAQLRIGHDLWEQLCASS